MKTKPERETPSKNKPESSADISTRTFAVCVAAALVPGLGHALLRKWDRAAVFFGSIACMFTTGLFLEGELFGPEFNTIFSILKFVADAGSGLMYWIAWSSGLGAGNPTVYTYDYANVFLYVAGLLNMLVIVDVFDIAMGRKQ